MSELKNGFKEAVCIEVQRVFDSCSDRDCIYELPVTLDEGSPSITHDMDVVRIRCTEVDVTCIAVNPVPFKSGYYAVDITYRFKISAEAFSQNFCKPQNSTILCGTAYWNKRVILYGSEGNAKVFTSEQELTSSSYEKSPHKCSCCCGNVASMPKATVQAVDPIALDAKFVCVPSHHGNHEGSCADDVLPDYASLKPPAYERRLAVSLGLFSIVQLSRPVSLIVPAYDYCIPCKDCSVGEVSESPCDVFDRMEFPSEQFFPKPECDTSKLGSCKSCVSDAGNITNSAQS